MNMSRYLQKKLFDHVFDFASYSAPADIYLSLHTAALNDASGATDGELSTSGTGYARLAIGSFLDAMTLATGRSVNNSLIAIGPALTEWGVIAGIGFSDASTGGNLLFWATPTTPRLIVVDGSFELEASRLIFDFN
jgi:hypothetical protein